jgi:hypothetical protein
LAETDRVESELLREGSEDERESSEAQRMSNESARQANESGRVTAESSRAYWAAFDPLRQYAIGEKAYYEPTGSSYICTAVPPIGALPTDASYWSIVVRKGDVQFASFKVDATGDLIMTTTPDYAGPTFALTSNGDLEVTV